MQKKLVVGVAMAASMAFAQDKVERRVEVRVAGPQSAAPGGDVMIFGAPGGPGRTVAFIGAEVGEPEGVKGAPYAADVTTENVQTLGDGTRISHRTQSAVYRDADGRTRREVSIGKPEEGRRMVTIQDPVAQVHYLIDPMDGRVRKIAIPKGDGTFTFKRKPSGVPGTPQISEHIQIQTQTAVREAVSGAVAGAVRQAIAGAVRGPEMHWTPEAEGAVTTEDLGVRTMEGIQVRGTRTTTTIPAGRIGNDRDIVSSTERWYSEELKTVVYSKRTDPRFGDSTTTLTNLRRSDQPRNLFEPPAGATVEEIKPGVQMRHGANL
jgi:hypothetical protein